MTESLSEAYQDLCDALDNPDYYISEAKKKHIMRMNKSIENTLEI